MAFDPFQFDKEATFDGNEVQNIPIILLVPLWPFSTHDSSFFSGLEGDNGFDLSVGSCKFLLYRLHFEVVADVAGVDSGDEAIGDGSDGVGRALGFEDV